MIFNTKFGSLVSALKNNETTLFKPFFSHSKTGGIHKDLGLVFTPLSVQNVEQLIK